MAENRPQEDQAAHKGDEHAHLRDESDGARRERRHPFPRERCHAPPRIFRFPRAPRGAAIVNDIVREPDHRHETAQEEIDLRIRCECIECAPIHQAKIRMVEHDVRAETAHDTVEALRREPLEERVRLSARAHAIDNIRTRSVFFKHAINGIHIVLQIRIHADGHVGIGTHGHEPCEECILMPLIVCEVDARA